LTTGFTGRHVLGNLDLGIVGNGQFTALVDRSGRVVWCCLPRFDSSPVFAALLDEERGGAFAIGPLLDATARQAYLRNTCVLVTSFEVVDGTAFDVIDFAPRFFQNDRYFKPACLVRILHPTRGTPRVVVRCDPTLDYGRERAGIATGSNHVTYLGTAQELRLTADVGLTSVLESTPFLLSEPRCLVLTYGEPLQGSLRFVAEELLERTIHYWRTWCKHCSIPGEFQDEVLRSAMTLKLHIFEDTGAIVAATTTSIPEAPGTRRTWDYRYCWLRDAYFVIGVLNRLGHFEEMEKFIAFLRNIAGEQDEAPLQPVYGIGGERLLEEREIPWLRGFRDEAPVRVGNSAHAHRQNDVYGEMVLGMLPLFFDRRIVDPDRDGHFAVLERLIRQARQSFGRPDAGIWEFRSEEKQHVFSQLMSWVALDRGERIARHLGRLERAREWSDAAREMKTVIDREGWNDSLGCFTQSFRGRNPDASNLLMPMMRFLPPGDPRLDRMIDCYERTLKEGDYVFRYRHDDDFGTPRTAFIICTFWFIEALTIAGRAAEARALFERVIGRANHLGLLSEGIDPSTGDLWGNFPQTYSHVGLITSALMLSKDLRDAF
jgi:GH15 family glucan-1,4-alpha-glucosidase